MGAVLVGVREGGVRYGGIDWGGSGILVSCESLFCGMTGRDWG
jgi:hypothetical protein